ncbi:MAG: esterase family protein [Saprospiraceae bacterium]|nr:esterase family protein [Saprospiraceae bacterium]
MVSTTLTIQSAALKRPVRLIILTTSTNKTAICPTLFFNDGQDFNDLNMADILGKFERSYPDRPLRLVGIYASDRIQEYGCIYKSDYKNRGSKAALYNHFITREFIPLLKKEYGWKFDRELTGFAGFSLGGLSAIDITLHNPDIFSYSGVFSGSFWWRYNQFSEDDPDGSRILHEYCDRHKISSHYQFWFEAGTKDEACDRNRNGIIDSIDDTLHLMDSLSGHGFQRGKNMEYIEVVEGTHDVKTWGMIMPKFLDWVNKITL